MRYDSGPGTESPRNVPGAWGVTSLNALGSTGTRDKKKCEHSSFVESAPPSGDRGAAGACEVCGGPASSRCARCRGVVPAPSPARVGHTQKSACAATRRRRAAGARACEAGAGSGGGGTAAVVAPRESDAGGGGGGGTEGLSAATLRDIASAVAMLGSRKPQERAAGARALAHIACHDVGGNNNRKLVEFQ